MQKFYQVFLVVLCSVSFTLAQQLQSPSDFLGYEIGTQFSRHHQVVDYFKHVESQMPNQVKMEKYGETYERRPLYVTYISSEENLKNLNVIRENNLKSAGIMNGTSTTNNIAIVWLSYNVHGNEASSTEASMKTLYTILTQKQEWLKNTVVIIDPCINPDGRDRYANWFNTTASKPYDIDPQSSEHAEPWPGGRPNHYLFDLNRDWAWASQIESQSRLKIYNKWMPHIHVDFHEQGINNPYYFSPAAEPFHEIITDWQRDFQTQIGRNHAKYFDAEGWLYFTRESFDLLYPSYGDTYPTYMGAIGMTYEQAGHSRGGLGVKNREGVLTLIDRVNHHTTTGLSTIEMSSKNASRLNTEFKKFFNNSSLKYKSYVLQGNQDKIEALKSLLDKHEITYGNPNNKKVNGFKYSTNTSGSLNATSKDLVVSTNQPKGKMIKALFEPNAKLSDSLTYDITAWSLPYAYGLDAIASTSLVSEHTTTNQKAAVTPLGKSYGYVSNWNSMKDAKFLAALLNKNFKIRFTHKPFSQKGKTFDRGSLIILQRDNTHIDSFTAALSKIATVESQPLTTIHTGFSDTHPDMGSSSVRLIDKPKIAMLSGDGTSSLSYGAIWHFFEQQLHYPVTSINTASLNRVNLDDYDVLILPSGSYRNSLNEGAMDGLKSWIRAGGKVIAIDRALNTFADKKGFGLKYNDSDDKNEDENNDNLVPYANRQREYAKQMIIGAIFKTKVDNTHPMAYGYSKDYFSLKLGSSSYSLLDSGNVAHIGDNITKVSGFAGSKAMKGLKNSLVFGAENIGRGSIVYMVDNTLFRSFWENGKLFFVNSIFFVNN